MTFNYQIFDVEIERQVDPSRLTWPTPEEDQEDSSFFGLLVGNQLYCDLRDISWAVARHVIEIEERCVKHIEESAEPSESGNRNPVGQFQQPLRRVPDLAIFSLNHLRLDAG